MRTKDIFLSIFKSIKRKNFIVLIKNMFKLFKGKKSKAKEAKDHELEAKKLHEQM